MCLRFFGNALVFCCLDGYEVIQHKHPDTVFGITFLQQNIKRDALEVAGFIAAYVFISSLYMLTDPTGWNKHQNNTAH